MPVPEYETLEKNSKLEGNSILRKFFLLLFFLQCFCFCFPAGAKKKIAPPEAEHPAPQAKCPGFESLLYKQDLEIGRPWDTMWREITPQNRVFEIKTRIHEAHASGNYGEEANVWRYLAIIFDVAEMAPSFPEKDFWSCHKQELTARLAHIKQAHDQGDDATERTEWKIIGPVACNLSHHEPMEPRWVYLVGMSFMKAGTDTYGSAEQWLVRCKQMPNCEAEMKNSCKQELKRIKDAELKP